MRCVSVPASATSGSGSSFTICDAQSDIGIRIVDLTDRPFSPRSDADSIQSLPGSVDISADDEDSVRGVSNAFPDVDAAGPSGSGGSASATKPPVAFAQFPRLAEIRAADQWEKKFGRGGSSRGTGARANASTDASTSGNDADTTPFHSSGGDSDGDSDGLYYSEPDSGAPARRLFHSVHGANQFTPGGTLVSVQPSGTPSEAQISGSDGTLIPTGQSKRRRHRVRRLSSGKLVRLGSEVSLKALSLVNPVNIANAVSSTQAPNLRRHAVLAEKLERDFPYQGLDSPKMKQDSFSRRNNAVAVAAAKKRKETMWFPNGVKAMDPRSAFIVAWEIILLLALSMLLMSVPIELAYVNYAPKDAWRATSENARALFIVARFFDAIFFLDIVINFLTGFYHENTHAYITSFSDVIPKYLGSWFLVDVAALVPYELFLRHGRALRLVKLAKLNYLVGHVRGTRVVGKLLLRVDTQVVEVVEHVYAALAIVHVVCCAWSVVLLYQSVTGSFYERDVSDAYETGFDEAGEPTNWVAANGVRGGPFEYYVAALQLLFQGEMTCTTLAERIMLVISMATFYALLIFILTEVMVLLGEITSRSGRYRTLLRDMNSMMRDHGFPSDLRQRMRAYLRFRHVQTRGNAGGLVNAQGDNQVLSVLSPQLRTEAALAMNKAGVASVPLFKQCNIPAEAILSLSVHAHVQVYAGHEYVFRVGDAADSMNVMSKGLVMAKGRLCRRGETFGREATLGGTVYTGSAFTLTNATVVHLSQHSFSVMFKRFPETAAVVRKVLAQRMAREALLTYARYMRAVDAGRGEQFRKNIFNMGFSQSMLARMLLTRSKTMLEFMEMEKLVVRMQRAWRRKMARRKRHAEKLRSRAERAGITPVVDADGGKKVLKFLDFGDVALLTKSETTDQRLDYIDANQRAMIETLKMLSNKLHEMDDRTKSMEIGGTSGANAEVQKYKKTGKNVLLM
jgi:hypothetical protein